MKDVTTIKCEAGDSAPIRHYLARQPLSVWITVLCIIVVAIGGWQIQQNRISNLESQITDLKTTILTMQYKIDELNLKIQQATYDTSAIKNDVLWIKTSLIRIEDRVTKGDWKP